MNNLDIRDIAARNGEHLYTFEVIYEHGQRWIEQAWGIDKAHAKRRLYRALRAQWPDPWTKASIE